MPADLPSSRRHFRRSRSGRSRPLPCWAKARRAAGRRRSGRRIRSTPSSRFIPMRASPAMAASFTDGRLVAGRPARCWSRSMRGENALEPERVSRKAASEHVLDGPRRHADPHDQRHRHRAVGHPRQGDRHAGRPAARRHLPRARAALLLAADGRAGADARRRRGISRTRASAPSRSAGGRSAARSTRSSTRRSCARRARRPARTAKLFVDAGASDAYWPHGLKWAHAHRRDAEGL